MELPTGNAAEADTVNGEDYTIIQLRHWLRRLEQPMSGNKASLVLRLNALSADARGECPADDAESEGGGAESENGAEVASDGSERGVSLDETIKIRELEMYKRERDLANRENELLKRELELYKQFKEPSVEPQVGQSVPLSLVKELIADFDENSHFEFWVKQVRSVATTYRLSDDIMRVIIVSKLKGKALSWLHSNINCATYGVDELLTLMENSFGSKESKLVLRQRFECRKWNAKEPFTIYFNEKVALANILQLDEQELVDYIIEGIPDNDLQMQAHIQCFKAKSQLLQAFSKIQLKPKQKFEQNQLQQAASVDKQNTRCFNCNSLGHWKTECRKPKRDPGTCYGCGSKDHGVGNCPERKPTVSYLEHNYVSLVKFCIVLGDKNFFINLEALMDTGSPISIVKKQCLPNHNEFKILSCNYSDKFYGINKSELKVIGKICGTVFIENVEVSLTLMVVADDTMSCDAILGRDFLHKTNTKLVFDMKKFDNANFQKNLNSTENDFVIETLEQDFAENCTDLVNRNENFERTIDPTEDNLKKNLEQNFRKNIIRYEHVLDKNLKENDIMNINLGDEKTDCVNISNDVDWHLKKQFISLFNEYYLLPKRPKLPVTKCDMRLILNSEKPFSCGPRRISYTEKQELRQLLDDYLENGYIRPSCSEYASAIVLVRKKTGELRMCIDFRNLNKITAKDNYPIPLIDDLLDRLAKKRIFTKLDLKNGFFHVFMHPESVKLTSFVTPLGQYEFLRMPFGLKNAPAVFQRFVNTIFLDMVQSEKVIIYLDDIMIATDNISEHITILIEVFKRIVENKLELRLDKCEFLQSKVKYLGYTVSLEGIQADEKGLEAIKHFPIPGNVHSVQSFLGLCSYFRRFVKNFSTIAKPLHDLTKKSSKFQFKQQELECFELLKSKLLESPVLALYDPNRETELHCDASSLGFGAILLQRGEDNKIHPVFYFSKRTSEAESKYHSFELETLAIVYALKRFRIYLQGKNFKIVTDCNSLTQTLAKKEINPRIARWALELHNYDYTLEHRSNSRMQHVDALSRNTNLLVIETNTFEENLVICQNRDEKIKALKKSLEKTESHLYEMRNGVLYKKKDKTNILFYVPGTMESQVIQKYHDNMGHAGTEKVVELIMKSYWFPKLREKVSDHIKNCLKCIVFTSKPGRSEGYLHNIPKGNKPFDMVHIDHFGPIDSKVKIKKHILVVIDAFTKFVRLYCTKTTNTKEAINALSDFFRAYSRPKYIVSDRGSCFTSKDFEEFLVANNVQHIKVATASPQANGQAERINRSIGPMLAKLVDNQNNREWYKVVETVEFALNNTLNKATGEHPSVLLYGISQRGKECDWFRENLTQLLDNRQNKNLRQIRNKARITQKKLQAYNKKYVDSKRQTPEQYKVGDYVLIRNFDSHIGAPRKLIPKFKGPYRIFKKLRNDRYVLKDVHGFQHTNIPYVGTWAINNIRPWAVNKLSRKIQNKQKIPT